MNLDMHQDEEHAVFGFYLFQQAFHCHSLIPSRHSQFRSTKSLCSFIQFTSQQFAFTRCFGLRDLRRNWRAKGCKHRCWLSAVSFLSSFGPLHSHSFLRSTISFPSTHPPTSAFSCQCPMRERRIRFASLHSGGRFRKQQSSAPVLSFFFLWSFVVDAALCSISSMRYSSRGVPPEMRGRHARVSMDDLEKNFLVFCACSSSVLTWCLGWRSLSNVFLSFTATSTRDARSTCNCEHGWSGKEFPGLLRLAVACGPGVSDGSHGLAMGGHNILKVVDRFPMNTPAFSGLAS